MFVNFGFNPGAEIGGLHYAVVMEDNDKSNGNVVVVPLGTLDPDQTQADLNKNDVYIGVIAGLNPNQAYAKANQIQPISKLRIYKPKWANHPVCKVDPDVLDDIDEKIIALFTRKYTPARQAALAAKMAAVAAALPPSGQFRIVGSVKRSRN